MTKKEMIDEMERLGCTKPEDRSAWLRKSKDRVEEVYKWAIPQRQAYLKALEGAKNDKGRSDIHT